MTVLCACGLAKAMVGTVAQCPHCDRPCLDSPRCPRCRHYSLTVNQRVTTEHDREKRK
ncbi:hypothetical protein GCM10007170_15480 [Arthrobacter liuii]|uniref:Uncharacterized protein n=1 Tax=Arthrobacter liuii TaxID=1476996 RepID=A0ABQ2AM17_9MICC|nr:hypothetical protein GCM10007170_15480 [Arthrobacter liuii]